MKRVLIANKTNFDRPWAAEFLSGVFRPDMRVCILTTEHDEGWASSTGDWEAAYGEESDYRYDIERPFRSFGIRQFLWCDPRRDEEAMIRRAIGSSDVLVLFGNDPAVCMDVLEDHDLRDAVCSSHGILVTLSEVSSVLCGEFENESLYDRSLREGLGILKGAHLCMHYDESEEQLRRMIRLLEIHGGSLIVLSAKSGVYFEEGHIELLGDAFIADAGDLEELYALL